LAKTNIDYKKYLASREWALKKEAVKKRADGICERCHDAASQSTHHLTYERIGAEDIDTDLLGVCNPCHEFLSAKSDTDPAEFTLHALIELTGFNPAFKTPGDWSSLMEWTTGPTTQDCYFHGDLLPSKECTERGWGDYMDGAHLVIDLGFQVYYHCNSY
jgi:hypothetical protein